MKVIRDNVCYVNYMDIIRYPIPSYFVMGEILLKNDDMVRITDSRSIEYIKNRKDIIDYDEVYSLDEEELNGKISEARKSLLEFLNSFSNISELFKEPNNQDKHRIKKYTYYGLLDYKANKDMIDKNISELIKNDEDIKPKPKTFKVKQTSAEKLLQWILACQENDDKYIEVIDNRGLRLDKVPEVDDVSLHWEPSGLSDPNKWRKK